MPGLQRIRADFVQMLERQEPSIDLARTALLVAAESEPTMSVDGEMKILEEWASELHGRLDPDWNNLQKLARLRNFVFEELGFRGDREHYFSPSNSLLHEVFKRRLGIPLTLSIVFLEIGWRIGVPLEGVGFPGHFLVRLTGESHDLLLDPYRRGMTVNEEDARKLLHDTTGGKLTFKPGLLASVGKREMIARLLHNLKGAYLRSGLDELALAAVDRLLLLDPTDIGEVRDRGLLLYRLHQYGRALDCLNAYLKASPNSPDHGPMERHVESLRQILSTMN